MIGLGVGDIKVGPRGDPKFVFSSLHASRADDRSQAPGPGGAGPSWALATLARGARALGVGPCPRGRRALGGSVAPFCGLGGASSWLVDLVDGPWPRLASAGVLPGLAGAVPVRLSVTRDVAGALIRPPPVAMYQAIAANTRRPLLAPRGRSGLRSAQLAIDSRAQRRGARPARPGPRASPALGPLRSARALEGPVPSGRA